MLLQQAYFLIASATLISLVHSSAIKGHAHPPSDDLARSLKSLSSNGLEKKIPAAPVAILESTKRIYNDESIRRFAAQQPSIESVRAVPAAAEQVVNAAVAHVAPEAPVAAPAAPEASHAPIVEEKPAHHDAPVQVAPVVPVVVPAAAPVVQEAPVVAPAVVSSSVPQVQAAPVAAVEHPKVVEAKAAPKPEELPSHSERSAVQVAPEVAAHPVAEVAAVVPVAQVAPAAPVVPVASVDAPVAAPVAPVAEAVAPVHSPSVVVHSVSHPATEEQHSAKLIEQPQAVPQPQQQDSSPLQARKDAPSTDSAAEHIEVPAPDPQLILSEPIDSTTKLLIDLDEHVQKFLPAEDQQQPAKDQVLIAGVDYSPAGSAAAPPASAQAQAPAAAAAVAPAIPTGKSAPVLVPYSASSGSGSSEEGSVVPPLPALDGVEKASAGPAQVSGDSSAPASSSAPSAPRQGGQNQNQQQVITQLLDQLDSLQNRIQDTINQLVARRRYVMSALLRPMGTYVRRVRTNLERLQNRVNQLQAAAVSVGGGNSRPGGFVDTAAIETIKKRIDDISRRISDIVNRIRFSLTPTSAPLNSNGRR